MGYVAVRGGGKAIEESLKLLECERVSASASWGTDEIEGTFPELVERPYVSRPVDTAQMRVARRVSAAFKDVPGGQVLGATRDYSHRLLAFDLETEGAEELAEKRAELTAHFDEAAQASEAAGREGVSAVMPRVLDYLRAQGLLAQVEADDAEPVDATMVPLSFPAPRSVRLQTLARGMTQAVEALGYAAIRGFGPAHPTVGELRQGRVAVAVDHPLEAGGPEDAYYLGSIPVTEVESVFEDEGASGASEGAGAGTGAGSGGGSTGGARAAGGSVEGVAAAAGSAAGCSASGGASLALTVGYGLVFGRAETKAIAMSVLDHCLEHGDARYPTEDEEFVLYHVDGVEATGFISHLKLPHYVTFQSKLSSVRETRGAEPEEASHAAAL